MTPSLRRAVWWLGACQCVFWGVLYYGFSVSLVPLAHALAISQAMVAGAFSLGLLVMALAAPYVGRALDRGHGGAVARAGAALAVVGLLGLATVASAWQLYVAWGVLGLAMAALLYESAFALVIRAVADPAARLHALAAVTVMGGLASTLFLPALALVTEHAGWRAAPLAGAGAVALAAVAMERFVLPSLPQHAVVAAPVAAPRASRRDARFLVLATTFAAGTVSAMAVTTLLIPLLIARDVPAPLAATALAALGLAQLPGRLWLLRGGAPPSARRFATLPLVLQAAGLAGIAAATNLAWSTAGVALFGIGAGLHTLARPWLVQRLYGAAEAGYWNGQLARIQGFGRALGPVLAVALAALTSAPAVLAAAGGVLLLLLPVAGASLRDPTPTPRRFHDDAAIDA